MSLFFKSTSGMIGSNLNEEHRLVPGDYTSATVDLQGHFVHPEAMLAALDDYRQWGTIREMHETPIGVADSIGYPTWNNLVARISKSQRGDEAWKLIQEGVYKAFSVGIIVTNGELVPIGQMQDEMFAGIPGAMLDTFKSAGSLFRITGIVLVENSIVDRPANPLARMKAIQTSTNVNLSGVLPAVYQHKGIDAITGVIHKSSNYLIDPSVYAILHGHDEVEKELVSSQNITEKSMEQENTAIEEAAVEVAESIQEAATEAVVEVIEQMAEKEAPVTDYSDKFAELSGKLDGINETFNGFATEVKGMFTKEFFTEVFKTAFESMQPATPTDEKAADEAPVAPVVVEPTEEQIQLIAEKAVALIESGKPVRKGSVNTETSEVIVPKVQIKELTVDKIAGAIARAAVGNK